MVPLHPRLIGPEGQPQLLDLGWKPAADRLHPRRHLGAKGASLAWMTRLGLAVPPGCTLSTQVWRHFDEQGALPEALDDRIRKEAAELGFDAPEAPRLLAVRSGGPTSMPGMLATVLDVGVSARVAALLAAAHGARFALDVQRRFVESYGTVALGVPRVVCTTLNLPSPCRQ